MGIIGWVITHDSLTGSEDNSRVGIGQTADDAGGFHSVNVTRGLSADQVTDPVRFRTLDDDGVTYYSGVIARGWLDGEEEFAFGPLAYAQADAGATDLQYRYGNGPWQTL